jgi:hypothetical protein
MLTVECRKCSQLISNPDGSRLPPWCPRCGADLRLAGADVRVAPVESTQIQTRPLPPRPAPQEGARPVVTLSSGRFFAAYRGSDLYRVYVTETDLLVLKIGSEQVPPDRGTARVAVALGGLLGGVLASVAAWATPPNTRLDDRANLFDMSDEHSLRLYAREGHGSFVADPEDIDDLRLEPPSTLGRLFGSKTEAVLTFRHRKEGRVTLKLQSTHDVRVAVVGLSRLFGDAVAIRVPWARPRRSAPAEGF